jgi:hypothetical protein
LRSQSGSESHVEHDHCWSEQNDESRRALADLFDYDRRKSREHEEAARTNSIANAAPVTLGRALLVFLLTEEIPTLAIALSLQLAFNYSALLHYGEAFGLQHRNVITVDFEARRLHCVVETLEKDWSNFVSLLSSALPFF